MPKPSGLSIAKLAASSGVSAESLRRSGSVPSISGDRYSTVVPARRTRTASAVLSTLPGRSEEHTSELQSLMRISYAVFCLKKKNHRKITNENNNTDSKQIHNIT